VTRNYVTAASKGLLSAYSMAQLVSWSFGCLLITVCAVIPPQLLCQHLAELISHKFCQF
jgi:hypothetical protein